MPHSLDAIAGKLDKLVELQAEKKGAAAVKEPTEEEKDEERLREVEAKLEDLVDLLSRGVTRESADQRIHTARDRVASGKGESRPLLRVFHDQGGKRLPTTRRTQSKMHLAESLKLRLRVGQHAQDLEHALHTLVKEQVQILERQLGRKAQPPGK
jgi:hypothetical protein